jgi:DNA-binding response OmpR family regulator
MNLTKNERKIFALLSSAEEVSTAQIQQDIYGWPEGLASKVDYTNVRMAVMRMKKKGVEIETVRGFGFRLITDN